MLDPTTGWPAGFPDGGFPGPQGPYYCGVGAEKIRGREIVEQHTTWCIDAGLAISGTNAEVMPGQWEFQIGPADTVTVGDHLWMARYLLYRAGEMHGLPISIDAKPMKGDWNGAGMHTNFSTEYMRETGGKEYFEKLMGAFEEYKEEHIAAYGPDNHLRLTGLHETQSIDKFSWGVADRGASVRVPHSFVANDQYKGYLEDRRPNSQADPYQIIGRVLKTIASVE